MPTSPIATYGAGRLIPIIEPDEAVQRDVNLATGTYAAGTVLGEVTATPGTYKAYASGNADGSQLPKGLLVYPCVVDGSGNITIGGTGAAGGEWSQTQKAVPMFITGYFSTADLTGLDANAVSNAAGTGLGRLVEGTVTAGILVIFGA